LIILLNDIELLNAKSNVVVIVGAAKFSIVATIHTLRETLDNPSLPSDNGAVIEGQD